MDKREYERRSNELLVAYEAAKRSHEQNPVPEQRSKALKELRTSYKREQHALTAEYEATNRAERTEESPEYSTKSVSRGWTYWLPIIIMVAIAVGVRACPKILERDTPQQEVPAETLPQEERR